MCMYVFICIYVCMCVCIVCMFIYVCMYVYMYVHVCMYVCACVYVGVCMYVCVLYERGWSKETVDMISPLLGGSLGGARAHTHVHKEAEIHRSI
jgi:hypothetical protein